MPENKETVVTTETRTTTEKCTENASNAGGTKKKTVQKNTGKNNIAWAWVLAGGMLGSAIIMCLCGRGCTKGAGCRECNKSKQDTVWVVKEKPSIDVDGDAIIINGDNNDATLIKGNGNNAANRSSGTQNQNRGPVKPKPKKSSTTPVVKTAPVVVQEPKPQDKNCTITISYQEIEIINGRCRQ